MADYPNPETPIRGHRVALAAAIYSNLAVRSRSRTYLNRLLQLIERFQPPVKPGVRARILPPLLRRSVTERRPRNGEHVVAYQGYTTFRRFLPLLRAIPSPVVVYGFDRQGMDGNLHFKKNSEPGFPDDLSSCRYVVCGGSHTLISEALYYG